MRLLVIGRSGQLALALAAELGRHDAEAVFLGREELELANTDAIVPRIGDVVRSSRFDAIVNAAAYTAVDKAEEEQERAHLINSVAPGKLAEVCLKFDLQLVHISTDYVFSGEKSSAYFEQDSTGPRSVYGRTKLDGEACVRAMLPENHLIVRTSWVYSTSGQNFVRTILRLGAEREVLRIVDDQHGCPTAASDLAAALLTMTDQICKPDYRMTLSGTYHCTGSGTATWCSLAASVLDHARRLWPERAWARVEAISTAEYPTKAIRPRNSVLDCSKLRADFGISMRPWQVALAETMHSLAHQEGRIG